MLRFYLQEQVVSLPKSTSPRHIQDNIHVFDFELSESEMEAMRRLDADKCSYDPNDDSNGEMLLRNYKVHD
jgi:diketogulonate reductase-like aldo/keto reductase